MVHKRVLLLLTIVLLGTSCQKEEIITYVSPENEAFPIQETEISENESENANANPNFSWIHSQQLSSGLLTSSENTDFVSLYDNALAAILYIQKEQKFNAEQVLDFFNDRLQTGFEMESGGFYQFRNGAGDNGNRRWLGDNAWLLIAVNHYKNTYGNTKYELLGQKLEEWIRQQQTAEGSLLGGFNEDGSAIPIVTEGIITAFNAVPGYDNFHKNILHYLRNNRWNAALNNFMAWPENEAYAHALDVFALSQNIFEEFPSASLDVANELFFTSQIATVTGEELTGYCFDMDKDVIWLEGSAQMAIAYQTIGNSGRSQEIITQIEKSSIQSFATENAQGIPYTANHGSNYGTAILWDHADLTPALSSTIWYLFAKMNFNPLDLGKQKAIPATDMFWLE